MIDIKKLPTKRLLKYYKSLREKSYKFLKIPSCLGVFINEREEQNFLDKFLRDMKIELNSREHINLKRS